MEPSAGRAHGLAGVTELLISVAEETGEPAVLEAAALRTRLLAGQARDLVRRSREAAASPLAASWCQGLTGIGQTLAHASEVLRDPGLAVLTRQAADACIVLLPRFGALGQPGRRGGRYSPTRHRTASVPPGAPGWPECSPSSDGCPAGADQASGRYVVRARSPAARLDSAMSGVIGRVPSIRSIKTMKPS